MRNIKDVSRLHRVLPVQSKIAMGFDIMTPLGSPVQSKIARVLDVRSCPPGGPIAIVRLHREDPLRNIKDCEISRLHYFQQVDCTGGPPGGL